MSKKQPSPTKEWFLESATYKLLKERGNKPYMHDDGLVCWYAHACYGETMHIGPVMLFFWNGECERDHGYPVPVRPDTDHYISQVLQRDIDRYETFKRVFYATGFEFRQLVQMKPDFSKP
jgi:hypothetical protein